MAKKKIVDCISNFGWSLVVGNKGNVKKMKEGPHGLFTFPESRRGY